MSDLLVKSSVNVTYCVFAPVKCSFWPIGSMYGIYIYMLTKLGYIDGKCGSIYGIHTDPMGWGFNHPILWRCNSHSIGNSCAKGVVPGRAGDNLPWLGCGGMLTVPDHS